VVHWQTGYGAALQHSNEKLNATSQSLQRSERRMNESNEGAEELLSKILAQGEQLKSSQVKLTEANEHTDRAGGTLTMLGISLVCEGYIQSLACFLCVVLIVLIVLMQMHIL
jgi:hypothetical protein